MSTRASNPLSPVVPPDHDGPSFLIGQDGEGHWVAVEIHGLGGGIFRNRDSAVHYARDESRGRPGAVRLVAEPLRLAIA